MPTCVLRGERRRSGPRAGARACSYLLTQRLAASHERQKNLIFDSYYFLHIKYRNRSAGRGGYTAPPPCLRPLSSSSAHGDLHHVVFVVHEPRPRVLEAAESG